MSTEIEELQINITLWDVEDDPTIKEMFRILDLNNDQDIIPTMNEEVETAEVEIKKSTAAGYK